MILALEKDPLTQICIKFKNKKPKIGQYVSIIRDRMVEVIDKEDKSCAKIIGLRIKDAPHIPNDMISIQMINNCNLLFDVNNTVCGIEVINKSKIKKVQGT